MWWALEGLLSLSLQGFSDLISAGYRDSVRMKIGSCLAGILLAEDILFVKRSNMKNKSCYRNKALKQEFALANSFREQSSFHTSQLLSSGVAENSPRREIAEHSLLLSNPVLTNFSACRYIHV